MSDVIVVENLVKKFKDVTAVNGISFKIDRGEVFALLGPNGAGKTTTIHIIATILKPTSGKVIVAGHDVVEEPGEVRKKIGIVFQEPSLDNQLTAYDNMYIHGRLYGLSGSELREKIMRLLEFVELKEYAGKKVAYFSGGMKRRLEIARSLLHEPEILILDEPTIGLDPQSRARIWDYIRDLKRQYNMTVLLTTHYMDEAEELANRVAIMDHGRIMALDTPEGLKNMLGRDVIYLSVKGDGDLCAAVDFAKECRKLGEGRYELLVDNASKLIPEVVIAASKTGLEVAEISYRKPTLNEVFLHLTGRELRDSLEAPTPMAFRGRRWF